MRFPWAKKQPARQPHLMNGQDDYVFRRSRTLTGTTSARVASTSPERGQLKTERIKLHELRAQRNQLARTLAGVLVVVALLVFLCANLIVTPRISYSQPGLHAPNTGSYQQAIITYLADHPLERFGFAINTQNLGAYLLQQHPELRGLTVRKDWYGGNVNFTLQFRTPLLVWKSGGQQFYVDDQGIAFTYNHFSEPNVAVTDQSGITPAENGGAVVSSRFIAFLGQMVGALNGYNKGKVTSVIIPASTREIDLKLTGRDYVIKTESDRDPLEQAQDINDALGYFDQKGIKPQYVDVRVPHKAFYKV